MAGTVARSDLVIVGLPSRAAAGHLAQPKLEGVRHGHVSSQVSLFSQMIRSAGELRPLEQQQRRQRHPAKNFNGFAVDGGSTTSLLSTSHLGYTPVGKPARIHVIGSAKPEAKALDQLSTSQPTQPHVEHEIVANHPDEAAKRLDDGLGFKAEEWTVYEELPAPPPLPPVLANGAETKTTTTTIETKTTNTKTLTEASAAEAAAARQQQYTEQRRRREASEATRARGNPASPPAAEPLAFTREEWTVYETIPMGLFPPGDDDSDHDMMGYRRYLPADKRDKSATTGQSKLYTKKSKQAGKVSATAATAADVSSWTLVTEAEAAATAAAAREFAERRARDGVAARRATTPVRLQKWTTEMTVDGAPVEAAEEEPATTRHRHRPDVSLERRRALAQSPVGYKRYLETAASTGNIADGHQSPVYYFYSDENGKAGGPGTLRGGTRRAPKSRVYKRANLRSYAFH